jgi:pyruvate ferredoxin oxidoreductase gamma subunit
MLGALVKVTGVIKLETLLENFKEKYAKRFKPEVFQGNLEAIQTAYDEVKKG